jgi:hypothetical protein
MPAAMDLTGETYGRWAVLARAESPRPGLHFLCQCACGETRVVPGAYLTRKRLPSRSCGCLVSDRAAETHPPIDLAGRRFGLLTVLLAAGRRRDGWLWRCQCDCGATTTVVSSTLRRLMSMSCGSPACKREVVRLRQGGMFPPSAC